MNDQHFNQFVLTEDQREFLAYTYCMQLDRNALTTPIKIQAFILGMKRYEEFLLEALNQKTAKELNNMQQLLDWIKALEDTIKTSICFTQDEKNNWLTIVLCIKAKILYMQLELLNNN